MKPIIEEMGRLLELGEPFALATVMSRKGSAPRSVGAKMLVRADGGTCGTVGGGLLEAQVRLLAARVIETHASIVQAFQFDGKDAATMDAICGGGVEVLVERLDPGDPQTAAVIRGLQAALAQHRKAWLATRVPGHAAGSAHLVIQSDGKVLGDLPPGLDLEAVRDIRLPVRLACAGFQVLIEPVNISGTSFIFGAGHVARGLAEFTHALGFWTVVLDDRAEYANPGRFPTADQILVLDSLSDWAGKITLDRDSYVVIVTRGHQNDLAVLAQALKFETAYTGMIGSRRKCELIFQELRRMGFPEEKIRQVHAPIGISIDAETPEEIGISIAAEMIQTRAALQKQTAGTTER